MNQLLKELIGAGVLKNQFVIAAFQKIDRKDFVTEECKNEAYLNVPLPIGYGQTISQPLTVAFMLEILQPEKGNKILEIGSGSGWQTALLS
ncbi:L-isoaspartyl protein carboxyl methyltransferase, partial [Patescibacteria group bacterium]|nr:L-isoaspartyl protein carboxyl methyltransferase [Patescibacteria group bacterium]